VCKKIVGVRKITLENIKKIGGFIGNWKKLLYGTEASWIFLNLVYVSGAGSRCHNTATIRGLFLLYT